MNPINFTCKMRKPKQIIEEWPATITRFVNHGSHYEMRISSRSTITVLFGEYQRGRFCCIPDWKAGCDLVEYSDVFWNFEILSSVLKNKVDATIVAFAIAEVGKLLDGNGRLQKAQ